MEKNMEVTEQKKWTEETMYVPSGNSKTTVKVYSPEFRCAIQRETRWVPIGPIPNIDHALMESIREGKPCPVCSGMDASREIYVPCRGLDQGIEVRRKFNCVCQKPRRIYWFLGESIPKIYRETHIDSVSPKDGLRISTDRQREIITSLRERPDDSYLLMGPSGSGKTHLMVGLCRRAIEEHVDSGSMHLISECIWYINASVLLDDHVRYATSKEDYPEPPRLTVRKVEAAARAGLRPCLFLDELDKVKGTEFKLSQLCSIIDSIYVAGGQIVATSNKTPEEMIDKWGKDEAETILRRIASGDRAHVINFG